MVLFGGACVVLFRGGMHSFIWGGVHGFIQGGMRGFFSFSGYNEIRSMSGRYASYWNAFLFSFCFFTKKLNNIQTTLHTAKFVIPKLNTAIIDIYLVLGEVCSLGKLLRVEECSISLVCRILRQHHISLRFEVIRHVAILFKEENSKCYHVVTIHVVFK